MTKLISIFVLLVPLPYSVTSLAADRLGAPSFFAQSPAWCNDQSRRLDRAKREIEQATRDLIEARKQKQSDVSIKRLEDSIEMGRADLKAGEAEVAKECKKS